LGGRKGIRPVKREWWGAGVFVCLEQGADLHMAQLVPLPLTVSCFSKIQIGFTFLVPAYLGSLGKRAVKRVCVCVCDCRFLLKLLTFMSSFCCVAVRGSRPGKNVQLSENEIRGLCLKSREIFLSQPILLELEAPLKICGLCFCLLC